jgi:hypothetical protein
MAQPPVSLEDLTRSRNREAVIDQTAYTRGWRAGVNDLLDELERAGCFTTQQSKRTVTRIRARLVGERQDG